DQLRQQVQTFRVSHQPKSQRPRIARSTLCRDLRVVVATASRHPWRLPSVYSGLRDPSPHRLCAGPQPSRDGLDGRSFLLILLRMFLTRRAVFVWACLSNLLGLAAFFPIGTVCPKPRVVHIVINHVVSHALRVGDNLPLPHYM